MMKIDLQEHFLRCFLTVALTVSSGAASAQVSPFDPQEGLNVVALGLGSAPDYLGSADNQGVIAPTARYYFSGRRYAQLLGPQLSVNVLDHPVFQFGPQLVVRAKRDDDVDDEVVRRMRSIDTTPEAGVFAAATWPLGVDPRQRIGVRGDVLGGDNGVNGTVTFNYFHPVSRAVTLNIGGGLGFSDSEWAETYFGVRGSDVALFPSRGGSPYNPSGGLMDNRLNFSAIVNLSPNWIVAAGGRYQRLTGDAADSPIVRERGDRNQWIFGIAVGYAWQ